MKYWVRHPPEEPPGAVPGPEPELGRDGIFLGKGQPTAYLIKKKKKRNHIRFLYPDSDLETDREISGTVRNNLPGSPWPCFFPGK